MTLSQNSRPSLWILLILLLSALALTSCRTKKTALEKEERSVSVLEQKDIEYSKQEKVERDILRVSDLKNISLTPEDPRDEMQIIVGKDTVKTTNARINFTHEKTRESDQSKIETSEQASDESSLEIEKTASSKKKDTQVKSASWGLNLGIILGVLALVVITYLDFKKPL